jgi:hypothetical protein
MKRILILSVFVLVAVGQSQDVKHAPTVAQCQADQRLWLSELESDATSITFTTLRDWIIEMGDCRKIDPVHDWAYYNTYGEASGIGGLRMMTFIKRHELWDKFLAEDAAGKR